MTLAFRLAQRLCMKDPAWAFDMLSDMVCKPAWLRTGPQRKRKIAHVCCVALFNMPRDVARRKAFAWLQDPDIVEEIQTTLIAFRLRTPADDLPETLYAQNPCH